MILRDVGPAFHHPTFVELPVCRSNPNDDGRCLQKIDHLQVAQFEVYVDLLPFYLYILPALANLLVLDRWVVGECLFFRDPPIYHWKQGVGGKSTLAVRLLGTLKQVLLRQVYIIFVSVVYYQTALAIGRSCKSPARSAPALVSNGAYPTPSSPVKWGRSSELSLDRVMWGHTSWKGLQSLVSHGWVA